MDEYNFDGLTIFGLRELARELGIKSPTTKNQAELKKLIKLAKYDNLPEKYRCNNKKGRPLKDNVVLKVTSDISPLLKIFYEEVVEIEKRLLRLKEKIKRYITRYIFFY